MITESQNKLLMNLSKESIVYSLFMVLKSMFIVILPSMSHRLELCCNKVSFNIKNNTLIVNYHMLCTQSFWATIEVGQKHRQWLIISSVTFSFHLVIYSKYLFSLLKFLSRCRENLKKLSFLKATIIWVRFMLMLINIFYFLELFLCIDY